MNYPRVLIVTLGRINAADTENNGLLLRNLFANWPRENLAQIYSSGENDDLGFFGHYYKMGLGDRLMGALFYKIKTKELGDSIQLKSTPSVNSKGTEKFFNIKSIGRQLLVDTGLYEFIFRPRLSRKLKLWVGDFQPDIIFSQGYNYSFALLPLLLSNYFRLPLAYYPTDDWPNEKYRISHYSNSIISRFTGRVVSKTAFRLVNNSVVRLAFNHYMREEYRKRYGKEFSVLMHGDDLTRFQACNPAPKTEKHTHWIVCTGVFGKSRIPLLDDLDQACHHLISKGIHVRATVFSVNELEKESSVARWRHINIEPCPSHNKLPSLLKGADILFLPERFDESSEGIRMSISSKAPLFMYSGKPIVVYSSHVTGIARYAKEEGWGAVVDDRDPVKLACAFEKIITDYDERQRLVTIATRTAMINHDLKTIQNKFSELLYHASFTKKMPF